MKQIYISSRLLIKTDVDVDMPPKIYIKSYHSDWYDLPFKVEASMKEIVNSIIDLQMQNKEGIYAIRY